MPPAGIDMSLIQDAIARRAQGALGGGSPMPATTQMTATSAPLPTGGPNTPTVTPSAPPEGNPQAVVRKMTGTATRAQSAQFDDDTRSAAKTLMTQMLKYI